MAWNGERITDNKRSNFESDGHFESDNRCLSQSILLPMTQDMLHHTIGRSPTAYNVPHPADGVHWLYYLYRRAQASMRDGVCVTPAELAIHWCGRLGPSNL